MQTSPLLLKRTVDVTKRVDAPAPAEDKTSVNPRVAFIQRGAAVSQMSMLDSEPRYASCTVIQAVDAGVLGRQEIALPIKLLQKK